MLAKLKRRLPDATDDALLNDLLAEAGAFICAYTRRAAVPEGLEDAQVRVAAILFNRMGMEGERVHGEGGVNRVAELLPENIACQLRPWRRARTVGE